jgi:hypothetical protein
MRRLLWLSFMSSASFWRASSITRTLPEPW